MVSMRFLVRKQLEEVLHRAISEGLNFVALHKNMNRSDECDSHLSSAFDCPYNL